MTMPEPTQRDFEWAYRLWNGLSENGRWTLPGVGVYVRTGQNELTLNEIHYSRPIDDAFGNSVFEKHDWIVAIAEMISWSVQENIEHAFEETGEKILIPNECIGEVGVCLARCGAIMRVEPLSAGKAYVRIDSEGTCPICGEVEAIEDLFRGIHVVIDDSAFVLKSQRHDLQEASELSIQEEFAAQNLIAEMIDEEHPDLFEEE